MPKILKDTEMLDIIRCAIEDPREINCANAYRHFLEDLAELICTHFGGIRGMVGESDNVLGWTVGFYINDCVPDDGWVFKDYDTDITWKDGEES